MKKIIAFVLAAVMMCAAFASCGLRPATTKTGNTSAPLTAWPTTAEPTEGQDQKHQTPETIVTNEERVPVTGLVVTPESVTCAPSSLFMIDVKVLPENATYKDLVITSSDPEVASYNSALGMYTAAVDGTTDIKIMTSDGGFYKTVRVVVGTGIKQQKTPTSNELTGIELSIKTVEMDEGDNMYIEVRPVPSTARIVGDITWETTDASIAFVDRSNSNQYVLYAVKSGSAMVRATTADGKFSAVCSVVVNDHADEAVSGVTLNRTEKTISVGDKYQLAATVSPSSAVNKFIIWLSSDENIATVDSTGKVTAIAAGTVTITVMTIDGGYTADCVFTIK